MRAWVVVALVAPAALAAQPTPPAILGRWDFKVQGPNGTYPSWLEVTQSGKSLVGRWVGQVGSARPVGHVEWAHDTVRFAIPPQFERGDADLRLEGVLSGGGEQISGTVTLPNGDRHAFTATRQPSLRRTSPPRWGAPIKLIGANMDGWTTQGGRPNQWTITNGVLASPRSGANLMTTRAFDDFKLHAEFRFPKGSNSGIYLRGRYEVQVEDDEAHHDIPDSHEIGGVYGFLWPNEPAAKPAGEWQTYDITLVGRRVTVVLNGKSIIVDQVIPGPTGGALDSDEAAPGPILLQGDHGPIEYRNLVITPARK